MRKLFPLFLVLIFIIQGCGVLSKTQVRQTKNYVETITNYSSLVRRTNESLAILSLESQTLKSSLEGSNQERINVVIKALAEYETSITPPDSIEQSLIHLENYVQGYYLLVTNGYDKYSQLKSASTAIGPLNGVAAALESLLKRKEPGVRVSKRDDLKEHLQKSSSPIRADIQKVQNYLANQVRPLIDQIENESKQNFEELLQSINRNNEPIDFYQNYNRELSRFYQRLYLIQKIVNHLDSSLDLLLEAESQILQMIDTRQKIEAESITITSLFREIEKAKALLQRL